jgi:hypothetical protein
MTTTKTTLEMPEALFRRAKAAAATRGQSLKQLVTGAIERELRATPAARSATALSALRAVRMVAAANAAGWRSELDSVSAVREQRR